MLSLFFEGYRDICLEKIEREGAYQIVVQFEYAQTQKFQQMCLDAVWQEIFV